MRKKIIFLMAVSLIILGCGKNIQISNQTKVISSQSNFALESDKIANEAMSQTDASLCDKINDPQLTQACKATVADKRDAGFFDQAVEKKDPALCAKLSSDDGRAKCVETVSQQKYKSSDQAAKDDEAFNKAVAGLDEKFCDSIGLVDMVKSCKATVADKRDAGFFDQAVEKKDPALCAKLSSDDGRAKCVETVSQQKYKSSDQAAKDDEAFNKAVSKLDEVACNIISVEKMAQDCKTVVARGRDEKLFDQAVAQADPALCEKLFSVEAKAQCIEVIEGLTTSNTPD